MSRKGVPNKRTVDIAQRLEAMGCDPFGAMQRLAEQAEEEGDLALAGQMHKELAQYLAPKRKAVEHTGTVDGTLVLNVHTGIDAASEDEIPDGV